MGLKIMTNFCSYNKIWTLHVFNQRIFLPGICQEKSIKIRIEKQCIKKNNR